MYFSLLSDVFPGVEYTRAEMEALKKQIRKVCKEQFLCAGEDENEEDGEGLGNQWLDKILQLYQITNLNHGLMIVGPSGSGKSTAWKVLLKALELHEGVEGMFGKNVLFVNPLQGEWVGGRICKDMVGKSHYDGLKSP